MNPSKTPKKVSDLTSLFEERQVSGEPVAPPRTSLSANVSPSKKAATLARTGVTLSPPTPKPRHSLSAGANIANTNNTNNNNTNTNTVTRSPRTKRTSQISSYTLSRLSDIRNNSSSTISANKTNQARTNPREKASLYLHGNKKIPSASDIIGSNKRVLPWETMSCSDIMGSADKPALSRDPLSFSRTEGFPLEHTSSADNLSSSKPSVKELILERQLSLEDTRKSPVHNDLKECELIMKRFADAKMRDLRNKFEKSDEDGGLGGGGGEGGGRVGHNLVKSSSANMRGMSTTTTTTASASSTLRKDYKSELKPRAATLGPTKTSLSEFLSGTQDKQIFQNVKFEISSSFIVTTTDRSPASGRKSATGNTRHATGSNARSATTGTTTTTIGGGGNAKTTSSSTRIAAANAWTISSDVRTVSSNSRTATETTATASGNAATAYRSRTVDNILQKKKLVDILTNAAKDAQSLTRLAAAGRCPSRSNSSSSSSSSISSSSTSSVSSSSLASSKSSKNTAAAAENSTSSSSSSSTWKKRGSYENVIQSGQVKLRASQLTGSSCASPPSGKRSSGGTNGVTHSWDGGSGGGGDDRDDDDGGDDCDDANIYDDIANTLPTNNKPVKSRSNQQQSLSSKPSQMNGRNSAKSSPRLVKHIPTVHTTNDDDDDDDFYETIDPPHSVKSSPKPDTRSSSSNSSSNMQKRSSSSSNSSSSSTTTTTTTTTSSKGGPRRDTPPPIPPRDKLPEAPPLPPRKQEDLNLKTVVPAPPQQQQRQQKQKQQQRPDSPPPTAPPPPPPLPLHFSPKRNRNSNRQKSSSNGSVNRAKPGCDSLDTRKVPCQGPEDYVCMKSPDFLTNSSETEISDLNESDYNEDNLYGVTNERYTSCFGTEPLYQFCGTDIRKHKKGINRNSHIYCEIGSLDSVSGDNKGSNYSSSKTSENQGSETLGSEFLRANSQRTLWHEMPQVKNSGLLEKISDSERKLQEAIFEVITSEASYLKSLNILMTTFLHSPEFSDKCSKSVLSRQERHELFSNIGAVRETSEKFLADLEARWKKCSQIHDICDIITHHVQKNTFNVYIRYCTNMTYQERMYNKLLKRPEFESSLKCIERKDACQRLPMKTFLLLPMQRITRIPLLIDSIRNRLEPNSDRHRSACTAHQAINKVVKQCNEGARQMECMEELIALQKQMQFKVKEFPLISASRTLVKKGEATEIISDAQSKIFKRTKPAKNSIYLFLFNDLLLITKKRGNHYDVVDYCSRAFLDPQRIRDPDKSKLLPHGVPTNAGFLILLVMLENFENKRVEMVVAFNSENDCERWLSAVTPVTVEGEERIYAAWDCPQVEATCSYKAYEKDELSLDTNDVVTVFRKLNDGWYYGERCHDGKTGWFPSEVTREIAGEHSRARSMRLKYQVEGNIEVE